MLRRHGLTLFFLALALVLYVLGAVLPATLLLVLGGIAELVFWVRLLRQSGPGSH